MLNCFIELNDPRSWLISYWLFASFVWILFLCVCFYKTRSGIRKNTGDSDSGCTQSGMIRNVDINYVYTGSI
jgi:hypothetical protein